MNLLGNLLEHDDKSLEGIILLGIQIPEQDEQHGNHKVKSPDNRLNTLAFNPRFIMHPEHGFNVPSPSIKRNIFSCILQEKIGGEAPIILVDVFN